MKKKKKKQPTCIPLTGTSRTDTWKPHQAETSSNRLWNVKLGARGKQIPNETQSCAAPLSNRNSWSYSQIPPHLARRILSPLLTFPPPSESRDQSRALRRDTSRSLCGTGCTPKAGAPPNASPALWSRPNAIISHSQATLVQPKRSSCEEMLMRKHSACGERHSAGERLRGVGKPV